MPSLSLVLIKAFDWLIDIIMILIVIRALMSWIPGLLESRVGRYIVLFTDPVLEPCNKLLMKFPFMRNLPIDFSPILAFLLLGLIQRIVIFIFSLFL